MPDPEALKAAMADPAVQKQVAEMSAAMQNEQVQKRFEELRVRISMRLLLLNVMQRTSSVTLSTEREREREREGKERVKKRGRKGSNAPQIG